MLNYTPGWWFYTTILKNDGVKVNGKDEIPYMKWKIKAMCETTNQTPIISLLYQVTQSVIEEGQRVGPLPFTRERNGQVVGVFGV